MIASFTAARFHRGRGFVLTLLLCAALPVVANAAPYRLGVDDVITVRVLYHPDFSVEDGTVRPDGCVNVPVAGDVVVAGRTVEEVAAEITEALRQELRDPQVSVRLVRRHVEPVYVLGAVRAPGAVDAREPVTVAEAIALAQGLSESAAPRWATLIDVEGRERRIDVLEALQGRGEGGATVISPGETLLVSAQFLVTVLGEVGTPGRYPAEEGDRVADAFAAAGGLSEDAALTGRLVRADGEGVELDLDAVSTTGDAAVNVALAPGDTIAVPRADRRVALVGAFVEPGKYDFDPGDRVSDALALGRDVDEDALLSSAVLMREDGSSQGVDLDALLQGRGERQDFELRDGDTLLLPRATDRVAVVGMVAHPGPLLLEPGMTLMDAIAAAGGWEQESAHPERTILWRQAAGGAEMTHVNAQKLLRGEEGAENPALAPGDIVYVPRDSSISRDEVARLLLGVSGLLRIAF